MSTVAAYPDQTWRDSLRGAGGGTTAAAPSAIGGTNPAITITQEPGDLYPITAEDWSRAAAHFSAGSSSKKVSWPDDHMPESIRSESATRRSLGPKGVESYQTQVPSLLGRAFLEENTQDQLGATPSLVSEYRGYEVPIDMSKVGGTEVKEASAETVLSRRQASYLRDNMGGAELGRLSYLGMRQDDSAPDAAAQEAAMSQYANLDTLPEVASALLQQVAMPIESGSALDRALAETRRASDDSSDAGR